MSKNFILICCIFIFFRSTAQQWKDIGGLKEWCPRCMYEDTNENVLYIGGSFFIADKDTAPGIVKWDGQHFSSLGCGVNWDCHTWLTPNIYGGYVNAITKYKGDIYVGGDIGFAGGIPVTGIAKWDGQQWDTIGSASKYGVVLCLKVINDELYVGGTFDSIGGIQANSLAKWNGVSWSNVHDFPAFNPNNFNDNYVKAIEQYKGEVYIGGNFGTYGFYDSLMDIAKFDGNSWVKVGGSMKGSLADIGNMIVYNNKLYVSGVFFKQDGNAGNNIQRWDGTQWEDVGGGTLDILQQVNYPGGQISDLKIHNGELFVCGSFHYAGGIPAQYIAKWDGTKWCGLGSHFNSNLITLGFCKDTLYIGGGFLTIDGDSMRYLAKWFGGNYVDTCSQTYSVPENSFENSLFIYPNPCNNYIWLELTGQNFSDGFIEIVDYTGKKYGIKKEIMDGKIRINTQSLAQGIYLLKITSGNSVYSCKFIKE